MSNKIALCTAQPVTIDPASVEGKGPSLITLLPGPIVPCRDGRSYRLSDPEAVISATKQRTGVVDLVIDYDHQVVNVKKTGVSAPAAGWIKELSAKDGGITATVEWTDRAAAMIRAKEYRYVSPTIFHDKAMVVTMLHSAALTNNPAIDMASLAAIDGDEPEIALPAMFLSALGLGADAGEEEVLGVIEELKAARVSLGAADEAAKSLVAELSAARNETRVQRVRDKVEKTIKDGVFQPYMRDWAIRTCSADEAGFNALVDTIGRPFAYLTAASPLDERKIRNDDVMSEAAGNIARQLGIDRKQLSRGGD